MACPLESQGLEEVRYGERAEAVTRDLKLSGFHSIEGTLILKLEFRSP